MQYRTDQTTERPPLDRANVNRQVLSIMEYLKQKGFVAKEKKE